jgi:hypothetical protein
MMSYLHTIGQYIAIGFTHVLPYGLDHLLFILSIFFLNSNLKSVVIQCSVFTFAHSIALGLAASRVLLPNSNYIEPLIALSILFTSIENIIHSKVNPYRLLILFGFGLIHGMGFATALKEIGIPKDQFFTSLISFNIGVEIAQILVLLLAYFLIIKWFAHQPWYKERVVYPISSLIGCVALYWTIERILLV